MRIDHVGYSEHAKAALKHSEEIAGKMRHSYVGTEHLLLGMLVESDSTAAQLLAHQNVTGENALKALLTLVPPVEADVPHDGRKKPEHSPRLERLLESARMEAARMDMQQTGTAHFLLGMLRDRECVAAKALLEIGVSLKAIFEEIMRLAGVDPSVYRDEPAEGGGSTGALAKFGTDLTALAKDGSLEPVVARDKELERMMQILGRKTKNNPCLTGEPGVGKTALAEGLAIRIAEESVPAYLKGKHIYSIDLPAMLAGSRFRGDFEEKMKTLIDEVIARDDVILFLDEIHTVIGAGGAEGSIDAASMLKPALARGQIRLIGATTTAEYRRYVEKDAALERRFQPVNVDEPGVDDAVRMLEAAAGRLGQHHHLRISRDILREAVVLSKRYISQRRLPDKAIDVLDEACARVAMRQYERSADRDGRTQELTAVRKEKEAAFLEGDMDRVRALHARQQELEESVRRADRRSRRRSDGKGAEVTREDIADVISSWTNIPVQQVVQSEAARLLNLEKELHKSVIGQEEAVGALSRAIKRGRVGLKEASRPIGSFLFLGPTGVGKTELSKALAASLFGSQDALIRFDMSEYMEMHAASKLIGSPPGYVGYGEGGQLTDAVLSKPYCVLLFDEVEKAHPDIFNLLLQVLDDGRLTDSKGRIVDFSNTVIIMTSNVGAKAIVEPKKLGFALKEDQAEDYKRMKSAVMNEVRTLFRPEFLNRLDDTIVFHTLRHDHLKQIVTLLVRQLSARLSEQMGVTLTLRDAAKEWIVRNGTDAKYGARPLRRALQTQVEDALTDRILKGEVAPGDHVTIGVSGGHLTVHIRHPKKE